MLCFRTLLSFLSFAFLILLCASAVNAQSTAGAASNPPKFEYEVVSVRPSDPNCGGMSIRGGLDRFSARCTTLWGLIFNAYPLRPNLTLPGLPGWANSAPFDVEAKMDDATFAALKKLSPEEAGKQRQQMLQAVLADRFKLKMHHESREGQIYNLVVAKGGFKLKEAPANEAGGGMSWSSKQIKGSKISISGLAFTLGDTLGRDVVDQTGLAGKYDITLDWTPDDQQGSADAGPSIFTAIQEQLGLKLVSVKGPVDAVIVDHAEKPSGN
jgi:uncharacterized protein (TIGR03435 family)